MDSVAARELLDVASADPADAEKIAQRILTRDGSSAMVLWALGLAQRNLGRPEMSVVSLNAAVEAAETVELSAEIQVTLAASVLATGDSSGALSVLDAVDAVASGVVAARAAHQRGGILQRQGDHLAARASYGVALAEFVARGDHVWSGHLHTNLGIMACYEGDVDEARHQLDDARIAYERAGQAAWVAWTTHNLAWVEGCGGRYGRAMALYNEAEDRFGELGIPEGPRLAIRAETMLAAGLIEPAALALDEALQELEDRHLGADFAEVLVLASMASELSGDHEAALRHGEMATRLLADQDRAGWVTVAEARVFACMCHAGLSAEQIKSDGPGVIDGLRASGYRPQVRETLLAMAAGLLHHGDLAGAEPLAKEAGPPGSFQEGQSDVRYSIALARFLERTGRPDEALDTLDPAYRKLVDMERIGSDVDVGYERGSLTRLAATTGRDVAFRAGLSSLAAWNRRVGYIGPSWSPVDDERTRRLLAQARALGSDMRTERLATEADEELQALLRELAHRRWALQSAQPPARNPDVLGDQRRLDLGVVGEQVIASFAESGTYRSVCPSERLTAIARQARIAVHGADTQAQVSKLRRAFSWLDGAVAQVDPRSQGLVLGCDDEVRGVPFGMCEQLAERPFLVARETDRGPLPFERPRSAVALLGPGLSHDVEGLRSLGLDVVDFTGPESFEAVSDVDLLYLGAHGAVEHGSPLLSSLASVSGPVFAHDLAFVERIPPIVVVGACDAATPGQGAVVGLSVADSLLLAGAEYVIAPVTTIQDDDSLRQFLTRLLGELLDGVDPGEALARCRRNADGLGMGPHVYLATTVASATEPFGDATGAQFEA